MLMDRDRRGRFLGFALVLVGVQVFTLIGYEWYMTSIDALSTRYHGASSLSWILGRPWWPVRAAYYILIQLQYLGMFLLPLLPFMWLKWRSDGVGSYSRWAYVAAGVVVLGMGVAVGGDILMNPRYTHLMQYDTVGHVMTIDFTYERLEFSRGLYPLWVVLHGLGLMNMFLIVVVGSGKLEHFHSHRSPFFSSLFSLFSSYKFNHPVTWIVLILGGYTVFISIGQFVFDRYLMLHLPLFVLVILYLASSSKVHVTKTDLCLPLYRSPASLFSACLLTLSFLFATIGVQDSFEWNRVRFGAIEQLEAQGITPHQIDGGAEYNSWQRTGPLQPLRLNEKSWWYVDGDEYAVAHEEIPGYERISAHPFTKYYGLERDTVYVIKRLSVNSKR